MTAFSENGLPEKLGILYVLEAQPFGVIDEIGLGIGNIGIIVGHRGHSQNLTGGGRMTMAMAPFFRL
jgi:hypothetical protein